MCVSPAKVTWFKTPCLPVCFTCTPSMSSGHAEHLPLLHKIKFFSLKALKKEYFPRCFSSSPKGPLPSSQCASFPLCLHCKMRPEYIVSCSPVERDFFFFGLIWVWVFFNCFVCDFFFALFYILMWNVFLFDLNQLIVKHWGKLPVYVSILFFIHHRYELLQRLRVFFHLSGRHGYGN